MGKQWKWLLFIGLLTLAFVIAGCTGEDTAGDTDEEQTEEDENEGEESTVGEKILIFNNKSEPTSLDPPIGNDQYSYDVLNNMGEGLTRLAPDEPVAEPAIAEDWDISEDATVYTFHLRDDVYWTNGEPVTAEDFEFSWKRMADPETAAAAAHHSYWIKGAEAFNEGEGSIDDVGVTAIDEKTLQVELENPTEFFPSIVAMPQMFPVHKETVESDDNWASSVDTIVSNGPFKMAEWDHDERILLVKNEDYWDAENVNLDGVEYIMIEEDSTAYQLYEADELYILDIPSDMMGELIDSEDAFVMQRSGIEFQRFNVNEEPFHNKNIRKAFNYAIDRQAIVDAITQGREEVAYGFVSYGLLDHDGNDFREVSGELVEYDPEKARDYLEQGMAEEGYDELPPVTLTFNTDDQHSITAQAIQEMLRENLEIDIELANQEWAVFLEAQQGVELQYSRSSFLGGFNDPINYLDSFTTGNPMNRTDWSNDDYDQLIRESYAEQDPEARFELLYEAEEILMEEAPIVPLYFYNHTFLHKSGVEGVVRHPVSFVEFKWADIN